MKNNKNSFRLIYLIFLVLLASCGGGSSSDSSNILGNSATSAQADTSISTPPNTYMSIEQYVQQANTVVGSGVGATISPADLRGHYNIPSNLTGVGQKIVIVDAAGYLKPDQIQADLNNFSSYYDLPNMPYCTGSNDPCLTIIDNSSGGTTISPAARSGSGDWSMEISLDLQYAHAIAPNASITLILAPNASALYGANGVQSAINQLNVTAVSMSFGADDAQYNHNSYDSIFSTAVSSKGIAFFASTGDAGIKYTNLASYPASSGYVTAVGGTQITSLSTISSQNETAWTIYAGGATGGGYTQYLSTPNYQTTFFQTVGNIVSSLLSSNSTKRSVPDVSINGSTSSRVGIVVGGAWYAVAGTSESSPIWAGISALIGEYLNSKGSSLQAAIKAAGSFNNLIYTKATYTGANPSFVDIITGNNNNTGASCPIICNTQVGYDDVTGIGAPNVGNFISKF